MTQLTAAICDKGNTVVALSDRMVTTADMTLGFESPNRKAEVIGHKSAVLIAGTLHEPDLVIDARTRARGKDRIRDIAEEFDKLYRELRCKRIEGEVLHHSLGISTFQEYQQKQRVLHDSLVLETNERVRTYDLGVELVLVGVDDKAHIALIANMGWRSFDSVAWCVVGMGDRHAQNVFAWYGYHAGIPLKEALYIAFEAKKKAEMAGGVGQFTDALFIDKKGIHLIEQETVEKLLEVYSEREHGGQRHTFDKRITELEVKSHKLENP
ncbi:hypothetical protein MYX77_03165 [Acidobacteriia bacterium AH_259_A11_L15]|nr:hypothetical protein [Acidobacteriia bacterium AH_259_A11_L15]